MATTRGLQALFLALLPLIACLGGSRFLQAGEATPGEGRDMAVHASDEQLSRASVPP